MKCLAVVVISLNAAMGAMYAQACEETQDERLPRGLVTIEEDVPTIQVEAKRWGVADEIAVMPRINAWVAQWVRSDLARKLLH